MRYLISHMTHMSYLCIFSGVIMYAMLVGKLPFTTPYIDQYRRQKLLQQIEKGLIENHEKEMLHLTKGLYGNNKEDKTA